VAIILNYVSFVRDELPAESQARSDIDEIGRAAERGASLTEQLLAFGQRKIGDAEVIDVGEVMAGMHTLLDRPLGGHIELRNERGHGLWPVEADRTDIEQIVLNLVVTARAALATRGGESRHPLRTSSLPQVQRPSSTSSPVATCAYRSSTTAVGIDADTLTHVWEPFFTTNLRVRAAA
jgi:two-component system cell cycle sensor histidine kinase/response regulator CckA